MLKDETYQEENIFIGKEIWEIAEKLNLNKRSTNVISEQEHKGFLIIPTMEDQWEKVIYTKKGTFSDAFNLSFSRRLSG